MSNKQHVNRGLQIGVQNNSGGEVYNAAGDITVNKNVTGASLQEFQSLLGQIRSGLHAANLSPSDKQDIEAILKQVLNQSQKDEPKKNLIVGPLKNAFELITQAAGAATSLSAIAQLVQKAIVFAQNHF